MNKSWIIEEYLRSIFCDVQTLGKMVSPRGQLVLEIENYSYVLPPYIRFFNFISRGLKIDYIKREFLWYLKGDRFDTNICEHASMWKGLINTDGSINSNYGQYMFGEHCQFDNVISTLKKDVDSRRASIVILGSDHLMSDTKDVPCTYALNFRIRPDQDGIRRLNMSVRMRSQDAVFGMGNDAPAFSFIHEMVYCSLMTEYPDLKLGNYHHTADSFHIYERHFKLMEKICAGDTYASVDCPHISGPDEVSFLRQGDFSAVPEEYSFSRWLNTFERSTREHGETGVQLLR